MNPSTSKKSFYKGLIIGALLIVAVATPLITRAAFELHLNVPIPGLGKACTDGKGICINVDESTLGNYVRALYVWFVGVAGIIATVMIMWAGVRWITAAGNTSRIESAKTTMNGAVIGLIILLGSYLLLTWINPGLISLRIPSLTSVETIFANTIFCENLNGAQFKTASPADTRGGWQCGSEYIVVTLDGKSTGETCIGRTCTNSNATCAWTGDRNGVYGCQNPKDACQGIIGARSQADCDRVQDTSADTGNKNICRYQDGRCKYLPRLTGCEAIAAYYGMQQSPAEWVSCQSCLSAATSSTDKTAGQFLRPDQCYPAGSFFSKNQLQAAGGGCKERNDLTGAIGIDAVCCKFNQDANKLDPFGQDFKANDRVCYMPSN